MRFKLIKYIRKINKSKINYKSKITIIDKILEKTILKIIPNKITPNHITIFRFVITPIILILLLLEHYLLVIILFSLAALSDIIDGSLARTKDKITTWGAIYDPVADKLLIGSVSLILISKYLSFYLGILIIVIELIIILLCLYSFKGEIPPAKIFGKVKGVFYSIGIFLIILYSLSNLTTIFSYAKISIYLGLLFAILSPIPYIKILKKT